MKEKMLKNNIRDNGNCIIFQFIENDHRTFNSYSKKFMFEQLLIYYKKGLNNWIEVFEKDNNKTKKEKHRLNVHKKLLLELNNGVDK